MSRYLTPLSLTLAASAISFIAQLALNLSYRADISALRSRVEIAEADATAMETRLASARQRCV